VADKLEAEHRLVGYCEEGGCETLAETFRFKGRFLCREHIMSTDGTSLPDEDPELGGLIEKLGKAVEEMAAAVKEKVDGKQHRRRRGPARRHRLPLVPSPARCGGNQ
jgi:hypothetical protein